VKIAEGYAKIVGGQETNQQDGQGLTTTLLALATLTLVGLALVVVLVSSSTDAIDLRKTIITALVSILASISGFYFGARTAQTSARQAQASGGDGGSTPAFTSADPPKAIPRGTDYSYDFVATGSPPPTYRLVEAPAWLRINSVTGNVTADATSVVSPFRFSVIASNSAGSVHAGPFDVRVAP